jgi:hypothetical protein
MNEYPRLGFFDIDPDRFCAMIDELVEKGTIEMSHPDPLYDDDCYVEDDSMDGDHESGLASAGWGTDEDYGYYGEDY